MSCIEVAEWQVFFELEPAADHYWIGAMISSVMANVMGDGKKKYKLTDFLPIPIRRRKTQSVEQSREAFRNAIG